METENENITAAETSLPAAPSGATAPATIAAPVPEWRDAVSSEIRECAEFNDVSDVNDLATKYLSMKRVLGGDTVALPKTAQEAADVFKKLGAPEDADGYDAPVPETAAPEDKDDIAAIDGTFKKAAFAAHLTKEQFTAFRDAFYAENQANFDAAETRAAAERAKVVSDLKAEWGASFDSRIADLNQICDSVGIREELAKLGAGYNPVIIKGILALGERFVEPKGAPVGSNGTVTTAGIEAQIASLMSDPAYQDGSNPRHKYVVDAVFALRQRKNGEF